MGHPRELPFLVFCFWFLDPQGRNRKQSSISKNEKPETRNLLVRNHPQNFSRVRLRQNDGLVQLALPLARLGSQDVTRIGMPALHLPGRRLFEALGSATVCFELWHKFPVRAHSHAVSF